MFWSLESEMWSASGVYFVCTPSRIWSIELSGSFFKFLCGLLCRAPGAESDEGSEASSDGENERSVGSGRSLRGRGFKASDSSSLCRSIGSDPRLECSVFVSGDDEDGEAWSYFETSPPSSRVPLVDKVGSAKLHVFTWNQMSNVTTSGSRLDSAS
jgi:hypothetical protein